jgi:glycosyltransferase involved in cell wall biosynthesis
VIVEKPLISIIMNCHNGEKFLLEAINTIYSQTFTNWEVIFWDNASTDSSAKIANSFDERIKYFFNDKKTPLGEARVFAVKKASGKYLAFLDCDDLWDHDKLSKQLEVFESDPEIGVVYSRTRIISNETTKISFMPHIDRKLCNGMIFGELAKTNTIPFVSILISKDKYYECGGFPKNYKNSMDYYLLLHILKRYRAVGLDEVLCTYRYHQNNLSKTQDVQQRTEAIQAVSLFLPDEDAKVGIQYHYIKLLIAAIKEKNFKVFFLNLFKVKNPMIYFEVFKLRLRIKKLFNFFHQ